VTGIHENAITVPKSAVEQAGEEYFEHVITGNKAIRTRVVGEFTYWTTWKY
jgi:hypothetical protein